MFAVVGAYRGKRFLLDLSINKGHTPEWTITEFFRLVNKWRPLRVKIEAVAYQRTLEWHLRQEMQKRQRFVVIDAVDDKRKKSQRIVQALSGIAANGMLYVHRSHTEFVAQFSQYPYVAHDDVLDAVAMAMPYGVESSDFIIGDEGSLPGEIEDLPEDWRSAP